MNCYFHDSVNPLGRDSSAVGRQWELGVGLQLGTPLVSTVGNCGRKV